MHVSHLNPGNDYRRYKIIMFRLRFTNFYFNYVNMHCMICSCLPIYPSQMYHVLPFLIKIFIINFRFMWPCIITNFFIIKPTRSTNFTNLFGMNLYMFRTFPLSIIRSLFTVHSAMVYVVLNFHKWVRITSAYMCTKICYR